MQLGVVAVERSGRPPVPVISMRQKLLFVDDSELVRDLVSIMFERAGYDVLLAGNGIEGLAQIAAHEDVVAVITDVNMPGMGGIEFLEQLRTRGLELPLFVLSTEAEKSMVARAKNIGVQAWFLKPPNPLNMLTVLRDTLSRAS